MKLIAETAWHHKGSFNFMDKLISALIDATNTDYIKLHFLLNEKEYFHDDILKETNVKDLTFDKEQWDYFLKKIAKSEKKVMLLLNDIDSIEFGMYYDPEIVEIHSVCLNDIHLLEALKSNIDSNTQVVLGIGGSTLYEVESAINTIQSNNIVLMHGFQNYPTLYEDINLKKIKKIIDLYPNFKHGYADHSAWNEKNNILITLFAASLGMEYIEKHVTTEYGNKNFPDWNSAISIEMFNNLENKLAILNKCMGNGKLELNSAEKEYSKYGPMKKAAFYKKNIKVGELLKKDMIEFKRSKLISNLSQIDVLNKMGSEIDSDQKKGDLVLNEHFKKQ